MDKHLDNLEIIEKLVASKPFNMLTAEERRVVLSELKEDEYENMRKLNVREKYLSPDRAVLSSLKKQLHQKERRFSFESLIFSKAATLTLCAIIVVLVLILLFEQRPQEVKYITVTRTDTMFTKSPADTIIIERVREKPVYIKIPVPSIVVERRKENGTISNGVTMEEKSELENLLVSGS